MLFSIIVPVYNSEKHLKRCINSIISQSYPNWELILVNDGSTDKSGDICDNIAATDKRLKVFHTHNGGVSKARNIGLNVSKGDWVTFCDSDDELCPHALESYLSVIKEGVDLIRAGFVRIKKNSFEQISTAKSVESDKVSIIEKCHYSKYEAYIWNSCFRRSNLNNIRFDESISWCEDHLFTFNAISKSRHIAFISEIVYKYYAPPKEDESFANNLSNRFIQPKLIIQEALEERDIKIEMCKEISNKCLTLINDEFDYKVKLALRYAVLGNKYITGVNICRKYTSRNFIQMISLFLHIKISPRIRHFMNFFKNKA